MGIVFFCQSCGARFEVDSKMAGKRGRCKKCGQMMAIPKAEHIASMVNIPALVGAGAPTGKGAKTAEEGPGVDAWLGGASSNVGLAPLTVDQMPSPFGKQQVFKRKPIDDDLGDSKPYLMATPVKDKRGKVVKQVSGVKMLYRKELGSVAKILRMINEGAYLASVPFLMVLLLGILTKSRSVAVLGATVVVLLNIGRVVTGFANMVVVPFREGPTQGVLFLVPPFTLIYLNQNWNKMRKATMRTLVPALTILGVVAAFTFLPSLSGKTKATGTVAERLKAGAISLEGEIKGEVSKAKSLDIGTLEDKAKAGLKSIQDKAKAESEAKSVPEVPDPNADPAKKDAPQGILKRFEKRVNDALDSTGGKSIDSKP